MERIGKAIEMRKSGATYEQIANELGFYDRQSCREAVVRHINKLVSEPAKELRRLESERLDRLFQSMYRRALDSSRRDAARCAEVAIRIMERRSQLLGLDAPVRIEEHVVTEDAVTQEIRRLEAELARSAEDSVSDHEVEARAEA